MMGQCVNGTTAMQRAYACSSPTSLLLYCRPYGRTCRTCVHAWVNHHSLSKRQHHMTHATPLDTGVVV